MERVVRKDLEFRGSREKPGGEGRGVVGDSRPLEECKEVLGKCLISVTNVVIMQIFCIDPQVKRLKPPKICCFLAKGNITPRNFMYTPRLSPPPPPTAPSPDLTPPPPYCLWAQLFEARIAALIPRTNCNPVLDETFRLVSAYPVEDLGGG